LPIIGIKYLNQLFNAVLLKGYFPAQWKVAQIILILKPGKPPNELTFYRPISLLSIVSKVFEKLLLRKLLLIKKQIIARSSVPLQAEAPHNRTDSWIAQRINEAHENKQYCSVVFLDVSQAFDKVWHTGLLYKLKTVSPSELFPYPKILFA
jgi:hypothetical protein